MYDGEASDGGRAASVRRAPARTTYTGAAVPVSPGRHCETGVSMDRSAGWVELLEDHGKEPVGRARAIACADPGAGETGRWSGSLTSLRLVDEATRLECRQYVLRFEETGEERLVVLEPGETDPETPVAVRGADGELPTCLSDEFGGE